MAEEKSKVATDLLGLAPYAEVMNTVVKGTVDAAGAFLSRICLPAAEEFGLAWKDRVSAWRMKNVALIASKAASKVSPELLGADQLTADPRLVMKALTDGSWVEDQAIQDMWAGLLASSCTLGESDESNLVFMNILCQLTALQVRVLSYGCETSQKTCAANGLITASGVTLPFEQLVSVAQSGDVERLDRELDHLRSLGLIHEGFYLNYPELLAQVGPTALALNLYVRAQGFKGSPAKYFGVASQAKGAEQ